MLVRSKPRSHTGLGSVKGAGGPDTIGVDGVAVTFISVRLCTVGCTIGVVPVDTKGLLYGIERDVSRKLGPCPPESATQPLTFGKGSFQNRGLGSFRNPCPPLPYPIVCRQKAVRDRGALPQAFVRRWEQSKTHRLLPGSTLGMDGLGGRCLSPQTGPDSASRLTPGLETQISARAGARSLKGGAGGAVVHRLRETRWREE